MSDPRTIGILIAPRYLREMPHPAFPLGGTEILLRIEDNDGRVMVDVLPDGRVELGDAYEPDMTARRFWASLQWFAEQQRRQEEARSR